MYRGGTTRVNRTLDDSDSSHGRYFTRIICQPIDESFVVTVF